MNFLRTLSLFAALSLAPVAAFAQPAPAAATKPTIVLVHGAWADASSWNTVIPLLQKDGYTVVAPPNELRGLANDAGVIATYLKSIPGPIILVGHSYGGSVISAASVGNSNVKALVYIDAFAPDAGESPATLLAGGPAPPKDFLLPVPFTTPAGTADVDLYLNPKYYGTAFASDLPASTSVILAVTQRPFTLSGLNGKAEAAEGWKTIPSWFVIGDADLVIPPALQLRMAQRAKGTVSHVPGGSHPSMIAHPEATVAAIEAAAAATAPK
jgi:pimeloyl-ACP methyl ester carboxylesterase